MSTEARWLLPRQQTEYPTKDLVSEAVLHGRREATFLVLTTLVILAIASLLAFGILIDPGTWWQLPIELRIPLGALPGPLGLAALMLACDLYGRRATTLVWAAMLAAAAMAGMAYLGGVWVVPLAVTTVVAHIVTRVVYGALRRALAGRHVALRAVIAAMIAQGLAWAAFAAILGDNAIAPVALGGAAFGLAATIALAIPLAITARVLELYLRVGRTTVSIEAEPDDEVIPLVRRRRQPRASLQPFSSAEMRFFAEGDELAAGDAGADRVGVDHKRIG
jgi:uncharacterized PurR-regulated membrane protein YhhQ (DUF165 family)